MSKTPVNMYIGQQIKHYRTKAGISQADLSKAIGASRAQLANIESGQSGTTSEKIVVICETLECTPNDLFPASTKIKTKTIVVKKTVFRPKQINVKKQILST